MPAGPNTTKARGWSHQEGRLPPRARCAGRVRAARRRGRAALRVPGRHSSGCAERAAMPVAWGQGLRKNLCLVWGVRWTCFDELAKGCGQTHGRRCWSWTFAAGSWMPAERHKTFSFGLSLAKYFWIRSRARQSALNLQYIHSQRFLIVYLLYCPMRQHMIVLVWPSLLNGCYVLKMNQKYSAESCEGIVEVLVLFLKSLC